MFGSLLAMARFEASISIRVALYPFVLDRCNQALENPPDLVPRLPQMVCLRPAGQDLIYQTGTPFIFSTFQKDDHRSRGIRLVFEERKGSLNRNFQPNCPQKLGHCGRCFHRFLVVRPRVRFLHRFHFVGHPIKHGQICPFELTDRKSEISRISMASPISRLRMRREYNGDVYDWNIDE
jgi:hypothetical protein